MLDQPGVAAALFRERLPQPIAELLADSEPELVPETFVSKRLRETQSDRLFRVKLLDGESAYLYCLVEHKSAPDARIGFQLLGYLSAIWDRLDRQTRGSGKLPAVVPLVVYHGASRWPGPRRFLDGVALRESGRPQLLDFPFEILDVGHVEVPALAREPHLRGGLLLLRYAISFPAERAVETLVRMLEDLRGMSDAFLAAAGSYMISQFGPVDLEELREAVHRAMPEKEEEMLSKAAAQIMEKGRVEGRVEGRLEGARDGKAQLVLRQIERKFGLLQDERRVRVRNAAEAELDLWSDRVLDAKSVEEVFGEREN